MDYQAITEAGGIPKPVRLLKPKKGLKTKTKLKAHYEPIPIEIKQAVLQEKGNRCFMGHCARNEIRVYEAVHRLNSTLTDQLMAIASRLKYETAITWGQGQGNKPKDVPF